MGHGIDRRICGRFLRGCNINEHEHLKKTCPWRKSLTLHGIRRKGEESNTMAGVDLGVFSGGACHT